MTAETSGRTRWTVHGERVIDDSRRARWSIADVELPDGVRFEQYVLRAPRAVIVAVVDADRVLMIRRHRFIVDRWVWELPGGYIDDEEDAEVAAAREVLEETGLRPGPLEFALSFQPMIGTADAENLLYIAHGAEPTGGTPDINEAERIEWIPLSDAQTLIGSGHILGSASIIALLHLLTRRPH